MTTLAAVEARLKSGKRRWPLLLEWGVVVLAGMLLVVGVIRFADASKATTRAREDRLAAEQLKVQIHNRLVRERTDEHFWRNHLERARTDRASIRRAARSGFAGTREFAARRGYSAGKAAGMRRGRRAAAAELRKISRGWFLVSISWENGLPVISTYSRLDSSSGDAYSVSNGEVFYRDTGF